MSDPEPLPHDEPAPASTPASAAKPLSAQDAAELAGRVAELSNAGLPLAPGLRAAAAEFPGGRLAAALDRLATAIDRGQSLEQALAAERGAFPRHLQALVAAGTRTGKLGQVLEEFVLFRQATDDIRRSVWLAAAYPAFLFGMLGLLFVFFFGYFLPTIADVLKDALPGLAQTQLRFEGLRWIAIHSTGFAVSVVLILAALAAAILSGGQYVRRALHHIPLWGTLWRHAGLAEFAQLLRILVANDVPLPEALRLTAEGVRDADVAAGCRRLAARVESGMKLSDALEGLPQFSPLLRPLLGWGESHAALPEALDTTVQLSMDRVQSRAIVLKEIVPPFVFLGVAAVLMFMVEVFIIMLSMMRTFLGTTTPSPSPLPDFLGSTSLVLLGCSVLLSVRLVYHGQQPPADALQELMRLAGRLLIAIGSLGCCFAFGVEYGLFLMFAALICWGISVYRLRRSQQAALLTLCALAAERQMPLVPLIRAWADEQGGVFFKRATRLADSLAAGTPFWEAVLRNPKSLPPRTDLAARIGEVNGALGPALRRLDAGRGQLAWLWEEMPVRLIGLALVIGIMAQYLVFMSVKIVPAFYKIFRDFHRELPPFTRQVMEVAGSPLTALLTGIVAVTMFVLFIYAIFRGLGWVDFDFPIVARLAAPLDAAVVLRWLSLVTERGQPLEPALEFLANLYPRNLTRRRLGIAAADLARGRDWADSLRAAKLIQRTDGAILRAAARVGNLPWALLEAAANGERRLNYRLHVLAQVLFPLLILAAGIAVMMFVVGWFLPLISLIQDLARPR